jgi:hypothetical protein
MSDRAGSTNLSRSSGALQSEPQNASAHRRTEQHRAFGRGSEFNASVQTEIVCDRVRSLAALGHFLEG